MSAVTYDYSYDVITGGQPHASLYDHIRVLTCVQSYTNTHLHACTKIGLIQFYVHVYDHMHSYVIKNQIIC